MMGRLMVEEKDIAPHIPVFDKSKRDEGTFSRSDFRYDPAISFAVKMKATKPISTRPLRCIRPPRKSW